MIITRTPYRISFFGGGTDYPAWYKENGGAVINTSIDKYCYLTVRYLPPFFPHKHHIVYSVVESVVEIDEIHHPAVRGCFQYANINRGIELHHDGDLPARSGIGSSSSFTVGLLHALYALEGKLISKEELASNAIHIEQEVIKENIGSQDQIAAAVGGLNYIEFGNNLPKISSITITNSEAKMLETHLLMVFTGFQHTASNIVKSYNFKSRKSELIELLQVTKRAHRLLSNGQILEFGKLLNKAWELKKTFSSQVSTPYIDYIYDKALKEGATGGKLLGAGGGGFMLLFVEPDKQARVKKALNGLLFVPFKFEKQGTQVIFNNGAL